MNLTRRPSGSKNYWNRSRLENNIIGKASSEVSTCRNLGKTSADLHSGVGRHFHRHRLQRSSCWTTHKNCQITESASGHDTRFKLWGRQFNGSWKGFLSKTAKDGEGDLELAPLPPSDTRAHDEQRWPPIIEDVCCYNLLDLAVSTAPSTIPSLFPKWHSHMNHTKSLTI